jgi:hypothetical protein
MILPGSMYGDIRKQAEELPHGLTPNTIVELGDRMEQFLPGLSSTEGQASKQFFDGLLPAGAEMSPRAHKQANWPSGGMSSNYMGGGSGGGGAMITPQRPYQPEFESPDRQQYPVHRILANRYWRLFYKLDPVIGNCIDMMSTMPFSDFQLTGEGVTGEIKESFETMCDDCNIGKILEYMVREFMVIGEAVPHCFFDDAKGIWTYIALHNPDQLEVIDAPFIKMEPVVEFIPDDRLRAVLTSNNHLLRRIREQMPQELISRLVARQNIPLSPINMTFIPRRLHPYDTRGTSIISRMWRILMYEDAIYNASIATARRHAGPIKVAKLGNPQTGWIPSPEHEKRLLQLLSQAELDVNAWLVYHYGINFEMVGTTDRIMNISQHHEVIERIKLIALGISKCFIHNTPINMGDGSYKAIQDVKVGDKVFDKDGKIQDVTDSWCEGVPPELTTITMLGKHKLTTTPNHYYPVYRSNKWCKVQANEICVGDYLGIPRTFVSQESDVKPDMARLLGYYVSDGYTIKGKELGGRSNGSGISFTFGIHESDTWGKDVLEIGQHLNVGFTAWPQEKRNSINIGTQKNSDVWLAKWMQQHGGEYAVTKCLSATVMTWPITLKLELIKGLYRGDGNITVASSGALRKDGTYRKQLRVRYATVSNVLAQQIQLILAQIGIYARLKLIDLRKYGVSKLIQSHLYVTGPDAYTLMELVWGGTTKTNIGITPPHGVNKTLKLDTHLLVPVTDVETNVNHTIPVYNLSVSGSHSYLAGNIASFNSFLHGEVTYASATTGLSVFLQRMKSMRSFFVNSWLLPKFFKPIAKINGWTKISKKELTHRYRIKRSQKELEQENRYIVPKIEWEKQLDQNVNSELVNAMTALEGMGIKFSKTTKYATVGRKFEDEVHKIKEEQEFERELAPFIPPAQVAGGPGAPGGGMPGGAPPPPPPGDMGMEPPGAGGMPGAGMGTPPLGGGPPGASASADKSADGGGTGPSGKKDPATRDMESSTWDEKGRSGNWSASEVHALVDLIKEGHTDSPLWGDMDDTRFREAVNAADAWEVLEIIEEHLLNQGYPTSDIKQLKKILDREGVLKDITTGDVAMLREVEKNMDDTGGVKDDEAMTRLTAQLDGGQNNATKLGESDLLYVGHGNEDLAPWSGDISDILSRK